MLDSTTDDAMPERICPVTPGQRSVMFKALINVRPAHMANPGRFDFAGLAPGAASDYTGPENP
ncbi:MAG: hypothetical protein ACTSVG_04490 [Alphaproteobacteria bacterium]